LLYFKKASLSGEAFLFKSKMGWDKMDVRETLTLDKPEELRRWLHENSREKIEIWLVFLKKSSGGRP